MCRSWRLFCGHLSSSMPASRVPLSHLSVTMASEQGLCTKVRFVPYATERMYISIQLVLH